MYKLVSCNKVIRIFYKDLSPISGDIKMEEFQLEKAQQLITSTIYL